MKSPHRLMLSIFNSLQRSLGSLGSTAAIAVIGVSLTGLTAHLQADDSKVKAPMEHRESTKTVNAGGNSEVSYYDADGNVINRPLTPTNLRENPADKIPFPESVSGFAQNPDPRAVKIQNISDALLPMGPPKPAPTVAMNKPSVTVDIPVRTVVEIPEPNAKTASAGVSEQSVTVNPFLDWIRNNKDAADIAKAQRDAYEQKALKEKMSKDASSSDLFLNIRFPYVGNQDSPPSGGSVIYTLPQR